MPSIGTVLSTCSIEITGILKRLLAALHKGGIITEDLAIPENLADLECVYRGLCRLPSPGSRRRRIDFLTVPWENRGAALLYYTVCAHFCLFPGNSLSHNI